MGASDGARLVGSAVGVSVQMCLVRMRMAWWVVRGTDARKQIGTFALKSSEPSVTSLTANSCTEGVTCRSVPPPIAELPPMVAVAPHVRR